MAFFDALSGVRVTILTVYFLLQRPAQIFFVQGASLKINFRSVTWRGGIIILNHYSSDDVFTLYVV